MTKNFFFSIVTLCRLLHPSLALINSGCLLQFDNFRAFNWIKSDEWWMSINQSLGDYLHAMQKFHIVKNHFHSARHSCPAWLKPSADKSILQMPTHQTNALVHTASRSGFVIGEREGERIYDWPERDGKTKKVGKWLKLHFPIVLWVKIVPMRAKNW